MKRFLIALIILSFVLISPILTYAAGSVTVTTTPLGEGYFRVRYEWTADASDGTVPATASGAVLGYIVLAVTDPGATAPTNGYSITITDSNTSNTIDVMGGELGARHNTNTEAVVPKIDSIYGARFVTGALTMNLSGNSVNSATGILDLYIVR